MSSIFAIDLGTGGPKVALISREGEVLDSDFDPTPERFGDGTGLRHGGADPGPPWWPTCSRATWTSGTAPRDGGAPPSQTRP